MTPAAFQQAAGIDPARLPRLQRYLDLLISWQARINLVGRATLHDPWRRHFLDSAQLVPWLPPGRPVVIDLGSGAGFPGLVLAMLTEADVHLVESDQRKCVFLHEVARATGTALTVHNQRIEALRGLAGDVVTARACAPLARLLDYAAPLLRPAGCCLFLKGRTLATELTEAAESWIIRTDQRPSLTDPAGAILKVEALRRRHGP
ncbi:MAG: 16S rRNA (guanine(527)-N(7))-methyltransferase RsmG [Rhodospirillales bacterium]|nr:MAG: 16S rRNA (guanine(527)-N(7))-methyltransferase RsmG [Rhodospirillales bacterium]